jgi:Xaa-Pro dipeptidase
MTNSVTNTVTMNTLATIAGDGVDFARLRADRRARILAEMEADGLDALILGSGGNVNYVAGARLLWTGGTRPFGPACVVVGKTGAVHLMSTWDEGVPPEIGHESLIAGSWNPTLLMDAVKRIPGLADAARVGTDTLSPGFLQLLPLACPQAAVVNGLAAIRRARRLKTPDEVTCIRLASAIAEAAMQKLVEALQPGITERQLLGVYDECIASLGSPTPPTEAVAFATTSHGPVRYRQKITDRPVGRRQLVILNPGAFYAGYESGLGRTLVAGQDQFTGPQRSLQDRCRAGLQALFGACHAGATSTDIVGAWTATGEPLPPVALVHGTGTGVEPPIIGPSDTGQFTLETGMVLSLQSWVTQEGVGGFLLRDTIGVTDGEPQVLTAYAK